MKRGDDSREAILAYLAEFIAAHQHPPTVRQIGEATTLSVATVHQHLRLLQDQGRIVVSTSGCHRKTVEVVA